MSPEDFEVFTTAILHNAHTVLNEKGKEYSRNGDRLWNFKSAAKMRGTTPEQALLGMLLKHWVSIVDILENPEGIDEGVVAEKFGDNINYSILAQALLGERRNDYFKPDEDKIADGIKVSQANKMLSNKNSMGDAIPKGL